MKVLVEPGTKKVLYDPTAKKVLVEQPVCVCPGNVVFTIPALTFTVHCSDGDHSCNCTAGALVFTGGEFSCFYQGGCNTPDCTGYGDQVPVFIILIWYAGLGWYIDIFFQLPTDPAFTPCNGQVFDTSLGDPVFLTSVCSPDGTYSLDLIDYDLGSDTGTVTFTIAGP